MKAKLQLYLSALVNVEEYHINHPINPVNPRATVLYGEVSDLIIDFRANGGSQVEGFGTFQAGSHERADLARDLREMIKDIARTARSLNADLFPGAADQFRTPISRSYQALLDTGRAFVNALPTIKQALLDRAMPVNFDADLAARIAAFETAGHRKARGNQLRVGGTSGLDLLLDRAVDTMQELDAIMINHLKVNDPDLLPVWKNARRVKGLKKRKEDQTPAAPTPAPQPAT